RSSSCVDSASPLLFALSLHDALPICAGALCSPDQVGSLGTGGARFHHPRSGGCYGIAYTGAGSEWVGGSPLGSGSQTMAGPGAGSEEHTSELQSRENLVCRLLLEKRR